MTYNDLKSRSRSIIYIIDICLGVRDKHTILEHHSFNISGDIMEKPKFFDPFLTFKVGQGHSKAFQQKSIVQATFLLNYV
jgi:hypothetical protein